MVLAGGIRLGSDLGTQGPCVYQVDFPGPRAHVRHAAEGTSMADTWTKPDPSRPHSACGQELGRGPHRAAEEARRCCRARPGGGAEAWGGAGCSGQLLASRFKRVLEV